MAVMILESSDCVASSIGLTSFLVAQQNWMISFAVMTMEMRAMG